jgi:hypothetical protein
MSLADFQAGFYRAVLNRAEAIVALDELPANLRTRLESVLATFYGNNTASTEGAAGVPGIATVSVSFQAGFELGLLLQRMHPAAKASDWGQQLANRLTTTGRNERRLRIRRVNGAVTVEELDG